MLTPNFNISQSKNQIILVIKAPMANPKDTELIVYDDNVVFYSSPYYLRLHLSGELKEIEETCGKYDADSGEFSFTLNKLNEGEEFKNLDLLGQLLIPSKKHKLRPEISLVEDESNNMSVESNDIENEDDVDDWYIDQEIFTEDVSGLPSYGFANKMCGKERELREEFNEILDLPDAAKVSPQDRKSLRIEIENNKFSEEHYLADLMEPGEQEQLMHFVPPWFDKENVSLHQEEKNYLKELGNRDYIMNSNETKVALLSLVDILFAYAYNYRTTQGEENNVESAWTVNKLSSTLSCFQSFQDITEVKTACVRRSLIFPLYRNWDLSMKVLGDTHAILLKGKRQILKCLIEIHKMFNQSEPRYLLNQLYITDYCIWLQKISEKKISHLALYFSQINLNKEEIGLDLIELESAAYSVKEEEEINYCANLLNRVELKQPVSSDDSEPDSTSSSEISSSSDSNSSSSSDED
ncbi:protein SHQ1 homolog [Cimex lectularius]|uniref:Protein SHQ1 homolog n=1 Tax=Cimex lectularius TaxID=79782 RepID=A0A8I6RJM0_CIMLE|nr:protein SHQ1 homolog [Cimex lectularius]XP_014246340.1 protein SHQ1 homolog [Cimex lectularius]